MNENDSPVSSGIELVDGEWYLFMFNNTTRIGVFHSNHKDFGKCFSYGLNWWSFQDPTYEISDIVPGKLAIRAKELQAENERLKEIIENIIDNIPGPACDAMWDNGLFDEWQALKGGE